MTAIELTPTVLDLIAEVSATEAQAELHRRAKPKKQRPRAASESARKLFAPILRQIAAGNTVVLAEPTPETVVSDEAKAEIIHMPVVVVTPVEEPVEAPIAAVVPITEAKKRPTRSRPAPTTKAISLRGLAPISSANQTPSLSLSVASLVEALKAIEAPTKTRQSILQILKCVVIDATGDTVTLTTTDLDVTMQVNVPAKVNVEGTVAIPFKELKAILPTAKKNQVGDVSISVKDDEVTVSAGSASSTLRSESLTEFPRLPEVDLDQGTRFELDLDAIASVLPATAKEDSRPILTGVLFDGDVVVATDSYRLHECSSPTMSVEKPMLVPHGFLANLVKRGQRATALVGNFNLLVTDETGMVAVSRLIEGEFPNYKSLFPTSTPERIFFDNKEMIEALNGLLAQKPSVTTPVRILESNGNKLPLHMVETDRFDVTVEVKGSSALKVVGYSPRYLRDLITGGFDHLKVADALKPCLAEQVDAAGRRERRLLMPVRIS